MSQLFEKKFGVEIGLLRDLYGSETVEKNISRVEEIHAYTEGVWREYVRNLGRTPVRYLLIAEAPPWSESGRPEYVLDKLSKSRSFMAALRGGFLGARSASPVECLRVFAAEGFLVLDSIPFAMNYSPKRSSKKYDRLISATTDTYLQAKIKSSNLEWSPDIRIAFAVARNARSILKSKNSLQLGGQEYPLSEQMIAVNGAGYPDAKKLREIFGLRSARIA